MGKIGSIVCTIVAMVALFILSHSPNNNCNHPTHRRLLQHRSNPTLSASRSHHQHQPAADYNQLEKQHIHHSHPEHVDDEWEEEDKFNVTNRIVRLFPEIDVDPTDWFVSLHELTQWNLQLAQREVLHRSQKEMDFHDKNHDGFVSFSESGPPSWVQNAADSDSFGCEMGWWKEEHFNASDADGDGLLNLSEFNDFLHPADSNNPKLQQWLCKAEVRERDTDRDGKVNFKEFFHGLFDLIRSYDEESHNDSHHSDETMYASARVLFAQLDKDGDGNLSDSELLPIIGKLHPSGQYYAKQQAEYIISQAEVDKDGRLTLTEMIENPYVFYSAIFNNDKDEYDGSHDEMY